MSLIPDVPVVVVVIHLVALGAIVFNSVASSRRRSAFLRHLRSDEA
jgi:hypothetical protein